MFENERKFERHDLDVISIFGPTHEVAMQSLGLTKNFSREGLGIEAREFSFSPNEILALELRSPYDNTKVSLMGNVVWKRQVENVNIAGIKLIFRDENSQHEILEIISSYGNIPIERVLHGAETHREIEDVAEEKPVAIVSAEQRDVPSPQKREQGFVKQYRKNGECKVTFRLPKEAAQDAQGVTIVGDFNNWDTTATPMTRLKKGGFHITLTLSVEREYRFRYLIDGTRWENDWCADKYIPNDFGSDDSVVIV